MATRKVMVNRCYGVFGFSHAAIMEYARRKGFDLYAYTNARDGSGHIDFDRYEPYDGSGRAFVVHYSRALIDKRGDLNEHYFSPRDIARDDPTMIDVVEEMGSAANGEITPTSRWLKSPTTLSGRSTSTTAWSTSPRSTVFGEPVEESR